MGLVRTPEELKQQKQHFSKGSMVGDTKILFATFLTDPRIIKRVLPPPLEPGPLPTGTVYVAEFGKSNFSRPYNEAAVFISAQYQGEVGNYCISMPVTIDTAMWLGRENQSYPKKIAEFIAIEERGNYVTGNCIRRGKRLITLTVQLEGPMKQELPATASYVIKAFRSITGEGFEYPPLLIRLQNEFHWGTPEIGIGRLTFGKSPHDPLHEIPIKDVILAGYAKGIEIWTQPGQTVAELDPEIYEPYYWIKQDWDY